MLEGDRCEIDNEACGRVHSLIRGDGLGCGKQVSGGENVWSIGWVCGVCARSMRLLDKWPRNGLECARTMEGFP